MDRRLQFGYLEHIGDTIAFTAAIGNRIDDAASSVAVAVNQIQVATDAGNSETKQQ